MIKSRSLLFSDFTTAWYKNWAKELKQNKNHLEGHAIRANKFWQNAVIAQILYERGLVKYGRSGIGFGVGQERLPALFAKRGVRVTATDQDFRTKKAQHWQEHELAKGTQSLNRLGICTPSAFKENVTYSAVDMKKISRKFDDSYNFVWSNCALGHLGSVDAGLEFIVNSARCLKAGGVAVHTTEINVMSNDKTVDSGDTVIFRPKDIYRLSKLLLQAGFELKPLRLDFGKSRDDRKITILPQFGNDYSKLQVGGHIITQVVLIVKRPAASVSRIKKLINTQCHTLAYYHNLHRQKLFERTDPFIRSIRRFEATTLDTGDIQPHKKTYRLTVAGRPKQLYLEYVNKTGHPIFGMYQRLHTTKPIMLATSKPEDRKSSFKAADWYNNQANRPSIQLCVKEKNRGWITADYVRPKQSFAYKLTLDPAKVKKGVYKEAFSIVQEEVRHIPETNITVTIKVC